MIMNRNRPSPVIGMFDAPMWEYNKQNEFRLQQCSDCGEFRYIPAAICHRCLSEKHHWGLMSGRGKIASWCIFHRPYFPEFPPPHLVILVKTEEGPIVVGNLLDGDVTMLSLDKPVIAVFEDVRWEDGSEGKIVQWRLAD